MALPSGPPPDLLHKRDAVDIPVLVRHSSPLTPVRRPHRSRVDAAYLRWPSAGEVAPPGDYLVTTTWRDVLDAALRVGRDPTPWLAWSPRLAWAEIVARRSGLFAYLARTPVAGWSGSGFAVEPNAVFLHGTERTAQAAFGYRLGMTMADWACRVLMGPGPTTHAETAPPPGAGPGWRHAPGLPDLTGVHGTDGTTWLIEAKGGRKVGLPQLRKGARQLGHPGIMADRHRRVLSGASVEHRLIVTLDIEEVAGGRADPQRDDDHLLADTRSRMLTYYALSALEPADRVVLPVGPSVGRTQGRSGPLTALEDDPSTAAARSATGRGRSTRYDMLVGRVPNTDLIVGLSRRLYGACRGLAAAQAELLPQGDWLAEPSLRADLWDLPDERISQRARERNVSFYARVHQRRRGLAAAARDGLAAATDRDWADVVGHPVERVDAPPGQVLEGATEDTYLAVDARSIL